MLTILPTHCRNFFIKLLCSLGMLIVLMLSTLPGMAAAKPADAGFDEILRRFSAFGNRYSGTEANGKAADYIENYLRDLGFDEISRFPFALPTVVHHGSSITLEGSTDSVALQPLRLNAITPQAIAPPGLEAQIIYGGKGSPREMNGRRVMGSIVLLEMDSGKNWLNAAALGAKAVIFIDEGPTPKGFFAEKFELSPIKLPTFWMPAAQARQMFGDYQNLGTDRTLRARLESSMIWQNSSADNIYCLIPGSDESLKGELIVVEAFYDTDSQVADLAPGADEAVGIATLLSLAADLKRQPPSRSVLLLATTGHAQTLAGMREAVWSINTRSKILRDMRKDLKKQQKKSKEINKFLKNLSLDEPLNNEANAMLHAAVDKRLKTFVDDLSQTLMQLRLQEKTADNLAAIKALAARRFMLRQLGWKNEYNGLSPEEKQALAEIIPLAAQDFRTMEKDARNQLRYVQQARSFRSLIQDYTLQAVVSLHLSSHGDGFGAFNQGWLHNLKPQINRVSAYSDIDEVMRTHMEAAYGAENSTLFRDTLRPSRLRAWQSYFLDKPALGGELSALAGLRGLTLVTVNDARSYWGTPYDTFERVNLDYARRQRDQISTLISGLCADPTLQSDYEIRDGYSMVEGQTSLMLHGELFASHPAPNTVMQAYQGKGLFYAISDSTGKFYLKGMSDKKHVLDKVILEGYRFDPETGSVVWAIDKKLTGKDAYRLKMIRENMKTDLIMFGARQTTLFNLLEPRNFRHMTKIELIDGRREAQPLRYWYSRIDTRSSIITSVHLEPGTQLKMTLSDTVLKKKLILTNATPDDPNGKGYLVDDWPIIPHTRYHIAKDMWTLLAPRISNLEKRGIFNERINNLEQQGVSALEKAKTALSEYRYDQFLEESAKSWALASRVYDDVEKTQKDVLFGVLFYIALFVPFAFCMERLLFCYANIYKRIAAFIGILLVLIGVIYQVHPAFQLAYSPMVVILAFFIIGLSFLVTMIIFLRFEEEMTLLQRRAQHLRTEELSRWKAFMAAFFLGVTNLRRRRLRTALTCTTLIILTFTIMSFTSVKSMRHHARILYQKTAPYQGILLKNFNWSDLPADALNIIANAFSAKALVAPRVWHEDDDRTRSTTIPLRTAKASYEAKGLVGLAPVEPQVTGLDTILRRGRWFHDDERQAVLLPMRMAQALAIAPEAVETSPPTVDIWGTPFRVVGLFSAEALQNTPDLDGEFHAPVTFPSEATMEVTEVEMEALESGEDVRIFQSRHQPTPPELTIIMPAKTLLAMGGHLKGVSIKPHAGRDIHKTAQELVDRFGLTLFSGEPKGTFLYNASDTLSYSGVPNIVIPLIISVFIVLNTMIGSVYERKKEIGIYTSVGLAPSHVSFLFIAESLAFAVISVVLGYLFAQTSASLFSGTSLWSGITVNYSSTAGVAAMVLVILVVLVSVIYPSKVAAAIAIPDVNRSWTLPPAEGSTLNLTLPFLMKYEEHNSIGGFILSYLEGHQDCSHGIFSTGDIEIVTMLAHTPGIPSERFIYSPETAQKTCLHLRCKVWLAPFDFGIMQWIDVQFCPASEGKDFLEIKIRIIRESGEANAWHRINKSFLHDLRKQLLVWRSLDHEAQAHYARELQEKKKLFHSEEEPS